MTDLIPAGTRVRALVGRPGTYSAGAVGTVLGTSAVAWQPEPMLRVRLDDGPTIDAFASAWRPTAEES